MARNHEKNYSKLNRLWLEKGAVTKEKRPKLSCLKTSDEISYWLPSIKHELDFFLKQTEVPCYTETKIKECRKRIMFLEAEYKAFVRKLHQLDASLKATPWTPRPYEKKDQDKQCGRGCGLNLHPIDFRTQLTQINLLQTPVLMHDHLYQGCEETNSNLEMFYNNSNADDPVLSQPAMQRDRTATEDIEVKASVCLNNSRSRDCTDPFISGTPTMEPLCKTQNVLGLDYSSSEEENL